jgi:hypothetical protein
LSADNQTNFNGHQSSNFGQCWNTTCHTGVPVEHDGDLDDDLDGGRFLYQSMVA